MLSMAKRLMSSKIIKTLSCMIAGIFLVSAILPFTVKAASENEINRYIEDIISCKEEEAGCKSNGEWIEKLSENAGQGSEWYVLSLIKSGAAGDYRTFSESLDTFVKNNNVSGATTRQRISLAMIACGDRENEFVRETVRDATGKLGVMSWIFGLHLLNNGCTPENYTDKDLAEKLAELRLPDGGWAVMGANSDVDVTAMALQALAPFYEKDKEIWDVCEGALALLSERQLEDGGFSGFGQENPESASQVIIALTSLGIDPLSDARFIKNDNTVLDGLLKYRNEDGSFSHVLGGAANDSACYQALLALVSLKRFYEGGSPVYLFDDLPAVSENSGSADTEGSEKTAAESIKSRENADREKQDTSYEKTESDKAGNEATLGTEENSRWSPDLKTVLMACVIGFGAVAALVLFITGRRNKKNFIFILSVCALLCVILHFTRIETGADYYRSTVEKENAIGTVTLTIRCDTVKDEDNKFIPKDGVILAVTTYSIEEGDTVYDILVEAVRENNIQIENRGSASGAHGMTYIAGINYLYEQQYGELSGWIYHVNGVSPSYGCGDYVLKDGDMIEWLYTCDLGRDLNEHFEDW